MASLSPVYLGTIISIGFLTLLIARWLLVSRVVDSADQFEQPKRTFVLK